MVVESKPGSFFYLSGLDCVYVILATFEVDILSLARCGSTSAGESCSWKASPSRGVTAQRGRNRYRVSQDSGPRSEHGTCRGAPVQTASLGSAQSNCSRPPCSPRRLGMAETFAAHRPRGPDRRRHSAKITAGTAQKHPSVPRRPRHSVVSGVRCANQALRRPTSPQPGPACNQSGGLESGPRTLDAAPLDTPVVDALQEKAWSPPSRPGRSERSRTGTVRG